MSDPRTSPQIIDFEELIPADWLALGGGVVASHALGSLGRDVGDPEYPSAAAILASALLKNGDNIGVAVWVKGGDVSVEVGSRVFRWCAANGVLEERELGPSIDSTYEAALDRAWLDMKRVWRSRAND